MTAGITSWNGLFAIAGTPLDVIARVNAAIAEALVEPGVRGKLAELGITPFGGTPAAIGARLSADIAKWNDVIARAGFAKP